MEVIAGCVKHDSLPCRHTVLLSVHSLTDMTNIALLAEPARREGRRHVTLLPFGAWHIAGQLIYCSLKAEGGRGERKIVKGLN